MNNEDFKVVLSDKEYIEKLEKEVHYQNKEVTRLNNIIKDVREYVNDLYIPEFKTGKRFVETTKLLEILDKEK